ncbi:MAG: hypothetical protein JXR61_03535 [Prolixibacteraceae bacterium]|nr:hypothetical protein [Prolixibacteraceae bacterium]
MKNIQHPTNKEITEGMTNGNNGSLLFNAIGIHNENKKASMINKRDIILFEFSNFIKFIIHACCEVIFVIIPLYYADNNQLKARKLSII